MNMSVVMPPKVEYGAPELKLWIRKYTYRAFSITMILLLLFWGVYFLTSSASNRKKVVKMAPPVKMELIEIAPDAAAELPPPPPPPTIVQAGPAARAGTPVPIPDADLAPDLADFANMDIMDRASSIGGDGIDLGGFSGNIDWGDKKVVIEKKVEEEPDPWEFMAVEEEPTFDYAALQKMVEYPQMARRAGIEGDVIIRALIDKNGKVVKSLVEHSTNSLFNDAALGAVRNYPNFQPAIQNKQPVQCWVSIPIKFKLR